MKRCDEQQIIVTTSNQKLTPYNQKSLCCAFVSSKNPSKPTKLLLTHAEISSLHHRRIWVSNYQDRCCIGIPMATQEMLLPPPPPPLRHLEVVVELAHHCCVGAVVSMAEA